MGDIEDGVVKIMVDEVENNTHPKNENSNECEASQHSDDSTGDDSERTSTSDEAEDCPI